MICDSIDEYEGTREYNENLKKVSYTNKYTPVMMKPMMAIIVITNTSVETDHPKNTIRVMSMNAIRLQIFLPMAYSLSLYFSATNTPTNGIKEARIRTFFSSL